MKTYIILTLSFLCITNCSDLFSQELTLENNDYSQWEYQKLISTSSSIVKTKEILIEKARFEGLGEAVIKDYEENIKQMELALDMTNQAILLEPDAAPGYYWRGRVNVTMGSRNECLVDFKKAFLLDSTNFEYAYRIAESQFWLFDFESAVMEYENALSLAPDPCSNCHHIYANRAMCYSQLGNPSLAISDYNRAIELKNDELKYYFERGVLLLQSGEMEKGCEDIYHSDMLDTIDPMLADGVREMCNE